MLHSTRGVVLRTVDFSDTSIIVKVYTEVFGIQSYLIKGAKRKSAPIKAGLFQPLALLDLVAYKKEKKQLQTLKEAGPEIIFQSIPHNPAKTSILFFMNDVLLKCLNEEENNPELFSFLHETVHALDSAENNFNNLHLVFMVRLSRFLGFFPQGTYSESNSVFDLREGMFLSGEPVHHDYITKENSQLLSRLISTNYYSLDKLALSGKERRYILEILLRFYELHISNVGSISSHKVLEEVFA